MSYRHALSDAQWLMLQIALPQRRGPASKLGDRSFIDAVLFRAKTGVPWRDLPERFGPWKTIYNKFALWSHRGYWKAIFSTLQIRVDEEGVMIDASVVRAHLDASGGKGGSKVMHWGVLEVDSQPRSMRSLTRKDVHSTSKSRRAKGTNRPSPKA